MVWLSRRCFERLLVPFLPLSSENHFAQPMHYSQQIENINVKEFACVRASKHNSESFFLHFYLKRWVYRVKWFNCFFCSTDLIIVRFLKLHLGSL